MDHQQTFVNISEQIKEILDNQRILLGEFAILKSAFNDLKGQNILSSPHHVEVDEVNENHIYGYISPHILKLRKRTYHEIISHKILLQSLEIPLQMCANNFFPFNELLNHNNYLGTKDLIESQSFKRTKVISTFVDILTKYEVIGVDIKDLDSRFRSKLRQNIRKESESLLLLYQ
jgi:hypothetical protein